MAGLSADASKAGSRASGVGLSGALLSTSRSACAVLDSSALDVIEGYILSHRVPGGGFRGRSGGADLYYSMFALWCLWALGRGRECFHEEFLSAAAVGAAALDLAHLASLIECEALCNEGGTDGHVSRGDYTELLASFRRRDGGYAADRESASGSLGGTYLAVLAHQRLGAGVPEAGRVVKFVLSKRAGAGFAESGGAHDPTVVSTAAAVSVLRAISPGCGPDPSGLWAFYRRDEGGFGAFGGAPGADLLSTAVALFVLRHSGAAPSGVRRAVLRFVQRLWRPDGGFSADAYDSTTDCEYTFYALLALGSALHLRPD